MMLHTPVFPVSFALGIPTTNRGNHTYLKQTLTSLLSRMTPAEEEDSVVIVAIAEVRMKEKFLLLSPCVRIPINGNHYIILKFLS
jgi:hypothetical protein